MATLNLQVLAGSDDARNINGGTSKSITAITQHLGKFNATDDYWNGFRWTSVTIPQGATITSATLDLYSAQVTAGTTAKTIWYGVKEVNTATYDSSTSYPEGKTRTTASVTKDFTVSSWAATLGFGVDLVDVTTLVQEIVNQASWASGNAMAIVAHDNGSASTNYIGHSTYDRAVDRGAKLNITYTTASNVTVTPGTASLTTSGFAPQLKLAVIAGLLALSTSSFAPSVSVSNNTVATPGITSLIATKFAPTVSTTSNVTSTPDSLALSTSAFAPTVSTSDNKLVTPGTLAIVTSSFAPTVTASTNTAVIPSPGSVALTTFAPSVVAPVTVIPSTSALTASTFAPTIQQGIFSTPDPASVLITAYAPVVTTPPPPFEASDDLVVRSFEDTIVIAGNSEDITVKTLEDSFFVKSQTDSLTIRADSAKVLAVTVTDNLVVRSIEDSIIVKS